MFGAKKALIQINYLFQIPRAYLTELIPFKQGTVSVYNVLCHEDRQTSRQTERYRHPSMLFANTLEWTIDYIRSEQIGYSYKLTDYRDPIRLQ